MKNSDGKRPQGGPGSAPGFARATGMPEHLKATVNKPIPESKGQMARPGKQSGNAGNEPTS